VESSLPQGGAKYAVEAVSLLGQAKALLSNFQYASRPDEIRVYGLLARAHLRNGSRDLALQAAEMVGQRIAAEVSPTNFYCFEGYAGVPPVYLELWEAGADAQDAAEGRSLPELARQACKGLRGYARVFPVARPRAWLWQGVYEWLLGKPRKAHKAWAKSLDYAKELNMPYEQGLAHYEIGRHFSVGDPGREGHLKRAVDIFTQLDAGWDLERAEQARTLTRK
jgi:hypothetical protein